VAQETPTSTTPASASRLPAHPKAFQPGTLVLTVLLSVLGSLIGLHLITTLGISANTSVVGALIAMLIGRVGFLGLDRFRDTNRQNLAQTAISSATFGAANSIIIPMGIGYAYGDMSLVWPLFLGAVFGLGVDSWVLYRSFGSRFLPANAAWPPGIAAAETIKAGDQGGRRAYVLLGGGVIGAVVSWFGISASAAGVALIGNVVALLMFGLGLLVNQYITVLPGMADYSLTGAFVPHGMMVGAGLVALAQAAVILAGRRRSKNAAEGVAAPAVDPAELDTVTPERLRRSLGSGVVLFGVGAVLTSLFAGLYADLSVAGLIGWILFAAVAAFAHELVVGLAAMHSGWFPAFAVTLIFMVIGLAAGFPQVPMVVLVGYCAATGPAFADMGYDLKAGWVLRKVHSRHPDYARYELDGRRQQYFSAIVGFVVGLLLVVLLWRSYFEGGLLPPVATVYADTIRAGLSDPGTISTILLWAVPGAVLQALGGPKRQMGLLLATGLLISSPYACWLVFAALLVRVVYRKVRGPRADMDLALVGAGIIAGDALASVGRIVR
jgi:uncharacterized oligopeptide transporter (OPT) family protein